MFLKRLTYLSLIFTAAVSAADVLKAYNIDPDNISISGVSSGAFMAVQMQVAHSSLFRGAGVVAGGIYWCAKGDARRAQSVCMNQPESVSVHEHTAKAREWEMLGLIDPLAGLAKHKVYIFASRRDGVIKSLHGIKLAEFYQPFIAGLNIKIESSLESAHGFPTIDHGNACPIGALPWLLKCNHDTAGEILGWIHGGLKPRGVIQAANLERFDQGEFDGGGLFHRDGWIYVPEVCKLGARCALHVALHGCQMNPDYIQNQFARFAGYNEWAETNGIILLYPQSAKRGSENPYGCWDWFGYGGTDYSVKSGRQITGLKAMIARVSGH